MRLMKTRYLMATVVAAVLLTACGDDAADDAADDAPDEEVEDPAETDAEPETEAEESTEEPDASEPDEAIAAPDEVNLSIGAGLAYAPLTIIDQEGWLEEEFPDTTFNWRDVTGGAATRDAMIAGEIDVGVSGTAPFLVGWAAGVEWSILGAQGTLEFWAMTVDDDIQTLEDLAESEGQISAPSPDSGQAIALRKNAADQLGDPTIFDDRIVAMGHPDAYAALITGQTAAAFTGPPFQYRLMEDEGARRIENADSSSAFGPITFTSIVMMNDFYDEYTDFAHRFFELLEQAQAMLTDDPAAAAQVLSDSEEGATAPEQWEDFITREENEWTSAPQGVLENGAFMFEIGMISQAPESLDDVAFPTVTGG